MAALWAVNATACVPVVKPGPARQEMAWPAYLGSPRHDAAAGETLNPDPRPLWRTTAGRAVRGAPALGESVLAVGTTDRAVVLVDRGDGGVFWRARVDGTIHGGPLLDDDRLYVATEAQPDGRVYALRLRDGRSLWRTRTGSVTAPLAFDGEALYAGTEDGTVLRLDPERGSVVWRRRVAGAVRVAPLPTPHGLAVVTSVDSLLLLDVATGTVRARRATPGTVLAAPASSGDVLYLATATGHALAVELPALSVRWEHGVGDPVYGAPALARDTVLLVTRAGRLWRIPATDPAGAVVHALGIVAVAGPTPLASGVLLGSVSGEVLLVDGEGKILWRAQVTAPIEEPPLVHRRQLVVVGGRGDIHAYR